MSGIIVTLMDLEKEEIVFPLRHDNFMFNYLPL